MHYVIKCVKLCGEKVETSGLYLFIYFNYLRRQTSRWTCSSATGRELSAVWPRLRREPGGSCWSALTTAPSAWETPRTDCCCARWRDTPRLCSAWRSVESDVWAATLTPVYCRGSEFHILKPGLCSWMLIPLCFFSLRWLTTWCSVDPVISVSTHTTSMWVICSSLYRH